MSFDKELGRSDTSKCAITQRFQRIRASKLHSTAGGLVTIHPNVSAIERFHSIGIARQGTKE